MGKTWILGIAWTLGLLGLQGGSSTLVFGGPAYGHPGENPVEITLLHVNDLHSRFKPSKGPLGLGGYARLKTAIEQQRALDPKAILVDGGDWSDGDIYYTFGAGRESLRMLDRLGVDISVVGNHDWLNGPDTLLDVMNDVGPKVALISANLSATHYDRADELGEKIPGYVVREVDGVKIAFIGLSTYEWVYDRLLEPVTVKSPLAIAHKLSRDLKRGGLADIVVGVSHNSIPANQAILAYAPHVDIIVGAHDHVKLTEPVKVGLGLWRSTPGWIVEAGFSGHYLGKSKITYSRTAGLKFSDELIQIDSSFEEDLAIKLRIEELDEQLAVKYPGLNDQVAQSEATFLHEGGVTSIGEVIADGYVWATGTPIALESYKFVYGEIRPGPMTMLDVYNINPAVYSPKTQKNWTVKKISMPGKSLRRILDLAYGTNQVSNYGLISVSGISFIYDPWFASTTSNPFNMSRFFSAIQSMFYDSSLSGVKEIRVGDELLVDSKVYDLVIGEGIMEGIRFTNRYLGHALPFEKMIDTGLESWRVLKDYLAHMGVVRAEPRQERIRTLKPDLSISPYSITARFVSHGDNGPNSIMAQVFVRVRNAGLTRSPGENRSGRLNQVTLTVNDQLPNSAVTPSYRVVGPARPVGALDPGEETVLEWTVPLNLIDGYFPLSVQIEGAELEVNTMNNTLDHWITPEEVVGLLEASN